MTNSKIQLYIATTLDGFIARENGSLDWLFELPNPNQIDHGYNHFLAEVDTVVMGRKTYEEILGFGVDWPYAHCKSFILTRNKDYVLKTKNTSLLHEINKETLEKIKVEAVKNIWVVGGGDLITLFLNESAIDEMILSIIPRILGRGIKLFPHEPKETQFTLLKSESFETGVVNLSYQKR